MLCRVEMPTHEAIFCRFYRYNMKKNGLQGNLLVSCAMALVLAGILLTNGAGGLFAVVPLLIGALYMGYVLFLQPLFLFRKKEGVALQTEVYVFTPSGFSRSVRSEEEGQLDHTSMQYSALVQAAETGKDIYLYVSPKRAYLVDKAYFTDGDPVQLRAVLHEALSDRFITRQK